MKCKGKHLLFHNHQLEHVLIKYRLEHLQVQVTTLVSLLFITMTVKLLIFSYTCKYCGWQIYSFCKSVHSFVVTGPLKSDQLSEQRLIGYIFAYWYQIGTMIEKAADTDEYLVRNTCLCVPYHDMMFSNAQSCCYNLKGQYTSSIISNFKSTLYCKSCISA